MGNTVSCNLAKNHVSLCITPVMLTGAVLCCTVVVYIVTYDGGTIEFSSRYFFKKNISTFPWNIVFKKQSKNSSMSNMPTYCNMD